MLLCWEFAQRVQCYSFFVMTRGSVCTKRFVWNIVGGKENVEIQSSEWSQFTKLLLWVKILSTVLFWDFFLCIFCLQGVNLCLLLFCYLLLSLPPAPSCSHIRPPSTRIFILGIGFFSLCFLMTSLGGQFSARRPGDSPFTVRAEGKPVVTRQSAAPQTVPLVACALGRSWTDGEPAGSFMGVSWLQTVDLTDLLALLHGSSSAGSVAVWGFSLLQCFLVYVLMFKQQLEKTRAELWGSSLLITTSTFFLHQKKGSEF